MSVCEGGEAGAKRVLVTGAGTGIGRAVALAFGRAGARTALHYAHSADGALSAVEELRAEGREAAAFDADFADAAAPLRLAEWAIGYLGGLDVLVNNAGITFAKPFEQVTAEQFDLLYAVNVRGPFLLTQAALPALEAAAGVVINLTSVHGLRGSPRHAVYAGTKGALVAWTRELAVELAPRGVRVNAIAPGAVIVENHRRLLPDLDEEALGRRIPCGFAALPEDIARIALFLASDAARYIVGQTLVADGGTTAWLAFSDAFRDLDPTPWGRGYVPDA